MSTFTSSGFPPPGQPRDEASQTGGERDSSERLPMVPGWSNSLQEAGVSCYDDENAEILRSFDMLFRVHQRSEELRGTLEKIDRVLIISRTVVGLVHRVIEIMQTEMDLISVRFLFREDHPIGDAFYFEVPPGIGTIPQALDEHEQLFQSDPYVLDEPYGPLARCLFGDASAFVASAAVASLRVEHEHLGLICLGSDDPDRYCGGINTDLIATLAEKMALGIKNAWDHECVDRRSLMGWTDGAYTESFFREYVRKEFYRSWRRHSVFAVMALSWRQTQDCPSSFHGDVMSLVQSQVRASDVVAEGETVKLWLLLPETGMDGARCAAERIKLALHGSFGDRLRSAIGITEFSRDAAVMSMLMNHARLALNEATDGEGDGIVTKAITLE
jgi:uncharacterized protein YigA (DUF484 family)